MFAWLKKFLKTDTPMRAVGDVPPGPFLWLETFVPADASYEVSDFIMQSRAYYVQYHTFKGFAYKPTQEVHWWDGKTPRFDAYAGITVKLWKIDPRDTTKPSQVMVDQVEPFRVITDKRRMDVWKVMPSADNGGKPTWFVIYQPSETEWWVCLASETLEKPA